MGRKTTDDKAARAEAAQIRADFWEEFERALEPKSASKQAYLDELEELRADTEARIECVREELGEDF
jgi:hypothetical protein